MSALDALHQALASTGAAIPMPGRSQLTKNEAMQYYGALRAQTGGYRAGRKPSLAQFATVSRPGVMNLDPSHQMVLRRLRFSNDNPVMYYSRPNVTYDTAGYERARYEYMRGSSRYADWTDEEIEEFVAETSGKSDEETQAAEYWEENRRAWDQANEDTLADRRQLLGAIEEFKEAFGDHWLQQSLQRTRAYWDAKKTETVRRVIERSSAMGNTPNPYVLAEIERRMVAQGADALMMREMELEQVRAQHLQAYTALLGDALMNTQRNPPDPATVTSQVETMGAASSPVRATSVGSGLSSALRQTVRNSEQPDISRQKSGSKTRGGLGLRTSGKLGL